METDARRVGVVILPDSAWSEASRRWRKADEIGFDHAWTYDQIGWRNLVGSTWYDAVAFLAAAAMVTTRVVIGTLVASANFRHPVQFVRSITALDDMSGGRLAIGLGAGGPSYDARVLGYPALTRVQRVARFEEFVHLLVTLLEDGRADYSGTYYSAVDARSAPGCMQLPRAPIYLAADGLRSMHLAASTADGWITGGLEAASEELWWRSVRRQSDRFNLVCEQLGRDPSTLKRILTLDAGPEYYLKSAEKFKHGLEQAFSLGFTDVVANWPRHDGWYKGDEGVLDEVADYIREGPWRSSEKV